MGALFVTVAFSMLLISVLEMLKIVDTVLAAATLAPLFTSAGIYFIAREEWKYLPIAALGAFLNWLHIAAVQNTGLILYALLLSVALSIGLYLEAKEED